MPVLFASAHAAQKQTLLHNQGMNNKLTILLALAAGMIGGLVSRYFVPTSVFAQAASSPQEIRVLRFVLVDENGAARGAFGFESNGAPLIEVADSKGRIYNTEMQLGRARSFMTFPIQGSRPCYRTSREPRKSQVKRPKINS